MVVDPIECPHLLPKFLCRNCSATFWDKTQGKFGLLTAPERKDMETYYKTIGDRVQHDLIAADFAHIERRVIARYRPSKLSNMDDDDPIPEDGGAGI